MGTFIVGAVVLCIVALAARCVLRKRKHGGCIGCGGSCGCGHSDEEQDGCCQGQHTK